MQTIIFYAMLPFAVIGASAVAIYLLDRWQRKVTNWGGPGRW